MNDNATYRILAKGERASNDTWATGLNNNDLIIGPTGAGKTRYYVKPNLLQLNESVVVTDTKGSLVKEVGPVLRAHGYRVQHLDFTDVGSGIGYNPLDYVGIDRKTGAPCEQDIMRIANAICPQENWKDPFWDNAAKMYLGCLIGYVMECLPREEHTLEYVLKLVSEMGTGVVDQLMKELVVERPNCFAARKWKSFVATKTAEKMHASIIGIMAEKLDPFTFDGTMRMFSKKNRVKFQDLGKRKTALFLTVSDTDRSLDRLVGLFYSQALHVLCEFADKKCAGHALPTPVRFYLDDFATNCRIADFDNIISVIRSRNIAVSVVLQSVTQLDALYGSESSKTILNGCDHLVYLGGQDVATAQFVSKKANKTLDSILNQPVNRIWLSERGQRAKTVDRYELVDHELYCELPEAAQLAM